MAGTSSTDATQSVSGLSPAGETPREARSDDLSAPRSAPIPTGPSARADERWDTLPTIDLPLLGEPPAAPPGSPIGPEASSHRTPARASSTPNPQQTPTSAAQSLRLRAFPVPNWDRYEPG